MTAPINGSGGGEARIIAALRLVVGDEIMDRTEARARFLEESHELAQASGASLDEVMWSARSVFDRPADPVALEVGQVATALQRLAYSHGVSVEKEALADLEHIERNAEAIAERHAKKERFTPPAQVGAATDSGEVTQADLRYQIKSEIETRFWSIVDEGEGMSVPSDMWDALTRIVRAARNRDMWKSQCERQAEQLSALASPTKPVADSVEAVAELQLAAFLAGRGSSRSEKQPPTMDDWRSLARQAMPSTDQEGLVEAVRLCERMHADAAKLAKNADEQRGIEGAAWNLKVGIKALLTRARQMGSEGA